jgi:hypothetical protein
VRPGVVWAYGAQRAPWGLSGRRWDSEELRWYFLSAPMLQTPVPSVAAPPRRRDFFRAGPVPRSALPKRGGVVAWNKRGWRCRSSEEGWRCRRLRVSTPPRGRGLKQAPVGLVGRERQAPRCPLFRRASPLRRWASALHRGDSSRWRTLAAPPRRGCQVCFRSPGAEALGEFQQVPSGGPSVRAEARRCCPGCGVSFPSGPKAFWLLAPPKRRGADTVSFSIRPEGFLVPAAPKREGRHARSTEVARAVPETAEAVRGNI